MFCSLFLQLTPSAGRQPIFRKGHGSPCFLWLAAGDSKALRASAYPEPKSGLSQLGIWVADGARVPGVLGNAFTEIYHLGSTHLEKHKKKNYVLESVRSSTKFNFTNLYCSPILLLAPQEKTRMKRPESGPGAHILMQKR